MIRVVGQLPEIILDILRELGFEDIEYGFPRRDWDFGCEVLDPVRFAVGGYQVPPSIDLHRAYRNLLRLVAHAPRDSQRLG